MNYLNVNTKLPALQRSRTPNQFPKYKAKNITPILSFNKTTNIIKLPSGSFTKYMAISLKTAFDSLKNNENFVSPLILGNAIKQLSDLKKFSETLQDLEIIHQYISFDEVLEICCSEASSDQIGFIKKWISSYESKNSIKPIEKVPKIKKTITSQNLKNKDFKV